MSKTNKLVLIPVMLCFFTMGFVDLVGIAPNYVKGDFVLSDLVTNTLPSLVFLWFLIFSVPIEVLMDKIGRKKTALLLFVVISIPLLLPIFSENFHVMFVSSSLLGIRNALMQTLLNPLVPTVIKGNLAAALTFGQFMKAIASLMAPYIAMWGALATIPAFGLGWRVLFPIYMIVGVTAPLLLASMPIEEETDALDADENDTVTNHSSKAFGLLGISTVLLSLVAIICHVGIDVGTNTAAPKILVERLGMTLSEVAPTTGPYFTLRIIGCPIGSYFLRVVKSRIFFVISVVVMTLTMLGLLVGTSKPILYMAIASVGYGNSNIFSIVLSQALLSVPEKKNAVSDLMIMGPFGGTVFPLPMGSASGVIGQIGVAGTMTIGVAYLFTYITQVKH